jgi:hypothetical protein
VRLLDFNFRYHHDFFLCLVIFDVVKIEHLGIPEELSLLPLILQPLLMLLKVCLYGPYGLYGIIFSAIKGVSNRFFDSKHIPSQAHLWCLRGLHPPSPLHAVSL